MTSSPQRILVTGALGQIGSELVRALRARHGAANVVASDVVEPRGGADSVAPFVKLDVTDRAALDRAVAGSSIEVVYHLAAILSANGEKDPAKAWKVNMDGLYNVLEVARARKVRRVFSPSSIAVFGPATPRERTPQDTVLDPKTMYGVTKAAGEYLAEYYFQKFGLDVRGCRFPGIISHQTLPGGGTTDYAVAIFYDAVTTGRYRCFLREDTRLPMMYMPDCLKSILDLMDADVSRLKHHAAFNVTAMSFSAGELAAAIRRRVPGFACEYAPDFRQAIADSWPASLDDSAAREEWGWTPDYDLDKMVDDMLSALKKRKAEGTLNY